MATRQQFQKRHGVSLHDGGFMTQFSADTITAFATGGQTNATPLTAQMNRVTTVANPGDSVMLPAAALVATYPDGPRERDGLQVVIRNDGANTLAIFPEGTDTIDGGSASASISLPAGQIATFFCFTAGAWFTSLKEANGTQPSLTVSGAATLAAINGVNTETYIPQVLAAAGATQGTAGVITKSRVIVTVTASTEGVKLPVAATGLEVHVRVPGTVGVKVYPAANGKIDTAATNIAQALVAGKGSIFLARDTTRWVTIKGA